MRHSDMTRPALQREQQFSQIHPLLSMMPWALGRIGEERQAAGIFPKRLACGKRRPGRDEARRIAANVAPGPAFYSPSTRRRCFSRISSAMLVRERLVLAEFVEALND